MNHEQMSDSEINRAVAAIIYPGDPNVTRYSHRPDVTVFFKNQMNSSFDYCNSWSDAGPIIAGNGISIIKDSHSGLNLWVASSNACWDDGSEWKIGQEVMHENPLRAAMTVFLMMQPND